MSLLLVALSLLLPLAVGCDGAARRPRRRRPCESATRAVAAAAAARRRGTIGVSVLTLANPFFQEMADAMTAEAKKHGYEVRVVSAEMDPARQRDQVKDFLVSKVSAIILTPADSRAVGTAIKEANDAGVPVFTADIASMDPTAKVAGHVATDNYGGGVQAAQAVAEVLKGEGKVAILDHPEVESVIQRTKGFETEIAKTPGVKVVAKLPGGGARAVVQGDAGPAPAHRTSARSSRSTTRPRLGAVAALEAAGKLSRVAVVGFDGQPEAKRAIREGKIYADAIQYPQQIGALSVGQVIKYLSGDKVEPSTLIPTGLYRKADAEKDPSL